MSYRILYGDTSKVNYFNEKANIHRKLTSVILATLFCCLLFFTAIHYKNNLIQWILPGDADVTNAAISAFGQNVREGIPLYDALTAFCEEILDGAIN